MSSLAQFGPKTFSVGKGVINTFDGFGWTSTLATDKKESVGKKPTTTIKGAGADQIKLSTQLWLTLGVDPREEIASWMALKDSGGPHPFVLGNSPCGVNKYLLTKCDVSDVQLGMDGQMIGAKLALAFEEYLPPGLQAGGGVGSGAASGGSIARAGGGAANPYGVRDFSTQEKNTIIGQQGIKLGGGR